MVMALFIWSLTKLNKSNNDKVIPVGLLAVVFADLVEWHMLVAGTFYNMVLSDQVCTMTSEVFLLAQHQGPTFSL